jgi:hypothetical protein
MIKSFYCIFCAVLFGAVIFSCTKDKGIDPQLAYTDRALFDSCQNEPAFVYYKNDPSMIYPGTIGPHGSYKLKFNKTAFAALTDNGKLPLAAKFPERSFIVKEVLKDGNLVEYAIMYKYNNSWLWAELNADGSVKHSVKKESSVCTNCHSQAGNRDLVTTFYFH